MEKKLTKKELKELETKQDQLRGDRNEVISAVKNFWKDIEATKRYLQINNPEELGYGGRLSDEQQEKLLRRYDCLEFLKIKYEKDDIEDRSWNFVRMMVNSKAEGDIYRMSEQNLIIDQYTYLKDGIWNDDIVWNSEQMKLYMKLAKRFGYKYFIYTNSSSGALENISTLIKLGAKIVNTCTTRYYKDVDKGLIFDITEINLEEETKMNIKEVIE